MKSDFLNWYKTNFDILRAKLIATNQSTWLLDALFPAIELTALKYFDSKQLTPFNKFRWYYMLLFQRDVEYQLKFENTENYDVIFWPTQHKHYALQLPVYHQLKKINIKVVFITTTISLEENFRKDNVEYIQVLSKKRNTNRFAIFIQNLKLKRQALNFDPFKISNKNIFFHKVISDALTYRIPCNKALAIYNILVQKRKPKIIFLGYCFSTISFSIDKKCKEDGVNTASIQVGRLASYLLNYSSLQTYYDYGRFTTNEIQKYAPLLEVVEVGSVKMEVTVNGKGAEEVKALTGAIRKNYKSIALIAFSGPGLSVSSQGHIENLKIVKAVIEEQPDVYFIFKFHGKDSLTFYSEFHEFSNHLIIDQSHPMYQFDIMHLIKECDFLISGASTTLMEAAYWLKPVISLDVLGELKSIELTEEEFIFKCRNFQDLNSTITSILSDDLFAAEKMLLTKEFSDNTFSKSNIPPSERIAIDVVSRINKLT